MTFYTNVMWSSSTEIFNLTLCGELADLEYDWLAHSLEMSISCTTASDWMQNFGTFQEQQVGLSCSEAIFHFDNALLSP